MSGRMFVSVAIVALMAASAPAFAQMTAPPGDQRLNAPSEPRASGGSSWGTDQNATQRSSGDQNVRTRSTVEPGSSRDTIRQDAGSTQMRSGNRPLDNISDRLNACMQKTGTERQPCIDQAIQQAQAGR
jgi:hypothetical protein